MRWNHGKPTADSKQRTALSVMLSTKLAVSCKL